MKAMTVAAQGQADRLFAGLPVQARVGGGVTNAIALNETMVRGKTINLIQISLLVVVITALLLRSLAGGFLVLLPLATAALVNLGLMGWTGILLDGDGGDLGDAVGIGATTRCISVPGARGAGTHRLPAEATARALTATASHAYVARLRGYRCLACCSRSTSCWACWWP